LSEVVVQVAPVLLILIPAVVAAQAVLFLTPFISLLDQHL
jgi:hypothetical protein